jgi:putative sterol carrier protein
MHLTAVATGHKVSKRVRLCRRHHNHLKDKFMSVEKIFEKLEQSFNAEAAQGLDLVFQFNIEDDKTYHLVINDGTCKLHEGAHDDPSVTLIMNSETLEDVVSGETDGMQAFMAGQLRAEGDMMLATKLGDLFQMG